MLSLILGRSSRVSSVAESFKYRFPRVGALGHYVVARGINSLIADMVPGRVSSLPLGGPMGSLQCDRGHAEYLNKREGRRRHNELCGGVKENHVRAEGDS